MAHPVRPRRGTLPAALPDLEDLRTRMDQVMHAAFPRGRFAAEPWAPPADVEDTEDAYLVELELPGVNRDQITVEVAEGELDVHGEVRPREHTGVVRRHTRRIGQFDYRTTVPPNADTEHISADLANGVLTVRVPKIEKGKVQRIEVTS
ncbi:Hsp20/alpha crystallin family protein [Streptomyces sp. NPDC050121]|uniref:Hsp20/alpha crystallin family protein n=1 Tax=Streptomyces sp. NPDC050121 TaxID=3365601 RepID=UPI0037B65E75